MVARSSATSGARRPGSTLPRGRRVSRSIAPKSLSFSSPPLGERAGEGDRKLLQPPHLASPPGGGEEYESDLRCLLHQRADLGQALVDLVGLLTAEIDHQPVHAE